MAFIKTVAVTSYSIAPTPQLEGSDRLHLSRELRNISKSIEKLNDAVKEIQDYLESLP